MASWVSLGGKEGRTNIQISAEPGIELGTLWSESRDLTTAPIMPTHSEKWEADKIITQGEVVPVLPTL